MEKYDFNLNNIFTGSFLIAVTGKSSSVSFYLL